MSDKLNYARMIKDEYEINLMRLSAYLANHGVAAAIDNIRKSEAEASAAAEIAMRELWIKELSEFEVGGFGNTEGGIVTALWAYSLSGHRVPYGCDCPKNRKPLDGEVCLPVVWASIDSYQTENERTVIIGHLPEQYEKAYDAMLEARKRAFEMIKPGVKVGDLYDRSVSAYVEAGFNDYLPGRIGHGLGVSLHEAPSLDRGSQLILEEGMVMTIEPGLVFPGWGSTRHSDSVVVTKDGIEILTEYTEDRIVR
jgi:Xaa-Pro dipeptidase